LKHRRSCKFVEADEFCDLLLSTRKLWRLDEDAAGICGLLDPATGETFLIEDEKLIEHQRIRPR
jgi:hypothetical protein